MALSSFGKSKQSETPAATGGGSGGSSGGSGGVGNLTAFIDQGSEFEGKLSFKALVFRRKPVRVLKREKRILRHRKFISPS